MADTEEYFPRGGKMPVTKYFKQSGNFLGTTDKAEKTKRKPKKKSEDDGYMSDEFQAEHEKLTKKCAQGISYQTTKLADSETVEPCKKKKKISRSESSENINSMEGANVKMKNKKQKENTKVVSEESDAIKTGIQEDEEDVKLKPLSGDDLKLLDFTSCISQKNYKKRVVSLIKAINLRNQRIMVIDEEIEHLEKDGLNIRNKKTHTSLHTEKVILEERLKLLMEALRKAQEKFKEFPPLEPVDYKRKKRKNSDKEDSGNNTDKIDLEVKKKKYKEEKHLNEILKIKSKEIKIAKETDPVLEIPSAKDFWTLNLNTELNNLDDGDDSSGSEEEVLFLTKFCERIESSKKKKKKLTTTNKAAKARAEEEALRKLEQQAIEGDAHPRSIDQFERALLARPNCSEMWIAYMAFHLQATEIEKARGVGRKALKTISFREEQERLNVWLAMLNFESRFGTKESQQQTLEQALQNNDRFKLHSKLLDIYVDNIKIAEFTALVDLMLTKYKTDPNTYTLAGNACYKLGLIDKARAVMQKAIAVLDKKEHVSVIVQFALSERALGSPERSEALFEEILGVYPQRVDVCAVYVDALYKSNDIDNIRQVMERITSLQLPARKMKTLYKKWNEIEEKVGDTMQIERIRQKALEFIEKAQF